MTASRVFDSPCSAWPFISTPFSPEDIAEIHQRFRMADVEMNSAGQGAAIFTVRSLEGNLILSVRRVPTSLGSKSLYPLGQDHSWAWRILLVFDKSFVICDFAFLGTIREALTEASKRRQEIVMFLEVVTRINVDVAQPLICDSDIVATANLISMCVQSSLSDCLRDPTFLPHITYIETSPEGSIKKTIHPSKRTFAIKVVVPPQNTYDLFEVEVLAAAPDNPSSILAISAGKRFIVCIHLSNSTAPKSASKSGVHPMKFIAYGDTLLDALKETVDRLVDMLLSVTIQIASMLSAFESENLTKRDK